MGREDHESTEYEWQKRVVGGYDHEVERVASVAGDNAVVRKLVIGFVALTVLGCSPGTVSPAPATVSPAPSAAAIVVAPTPTPSPTPTPYPTVRPTPTPPPWHLPNEVVRVTTYTGSGAIEVSTYKKLGSVCGYSSAGAGNIYLSVLVAYAAGPSGLAYSETDWAGHSQDSIQYETTYAGTCYDHGVLGAGNLGPGLGTGGFILFAIPRSTTHFYLDWSDPFSGSRETWKVY